MTSSAKDAGDMLLVVLVSNINALSVSNELRRRFGEEAEIFQNQISSYLSELDKEIESRLVANCGVKIQDHSTKTELPVLE